ncbi:hypothetical protein VaNZ11_008639 [Volvox africanus]|uniref:Uncharacterized protein n=1 Tax=Volvox africanus TaxID=51714 RepID=A0ABQ5S5R8_9CHLO|nr:hypothetical protein VaNZ11_008639 [Volvox africanus]
MGGERIRPQCTVQPTGAGPQVPDAAVLGESSEVAPAGAATTMAATLTTTAIATAPTPTTTVTTPIVITTTNVLASAGEDASPPGRLVPQKRQHWTRSEAASASDAAGRHCRTARAVAGGGASVLTQIDNAGALIGAPHKGSVVTQIDNAATAPATLQRPLLAAGSVLRCVSDLELAVSHLRRRDPKLVPLIDAHGLPYSLVASTATFAAAAAPAAATTSTTSKALTAADSYEDPSLGCGKGSGGVRHSSSGGCGSTHVISTGRTLPVAVPPLQPSTAAAAAAVLETASVVETAVAAAAVAAAACFPLWPARWSISSSPQTQHPLSGAAS